MIQIIYLMVQFLHLRFKIVGTQNFNTQLSQKYVILEMHLIFQADVDGSGTLDIGEFMAVAIHIQKIGNDEHIRKAFAYFDSDHSGFIEIEELKEHLEHDLGPNFEEIINAIICDVDTDKVM